MSWIAAAIAAARNAARSAWQFFLGAGAGALGMLAAFANPPRVVELDPAEEMLGILMQDEELRSQLRMSELRMERRADDVDVLSLRGALADRMLGDEEPVFAASIEPHHRRWVRALEPHEAAALLDLHDDELADHAVGLGASIHAPVYSLGDVRKRETRRREGAYERIVAGAFGATYDEEHRPRM